MSTQKSAARTIAPREGLYGPSPHDAFMAPLDEIGLFDQSHSASSTATPANKITGPAHRRARPSSRKSLTGFWRGPWRALKTPTGPTEDLEPSSNQSQTEAKKIECLVTCKDEDEFEELRKKFKSAFGDQFHCNQSQDQKFCSMTFTGIEVIAGKGNYAILDFSGLDKNIALRFEDCLIDVMDFSFAKLYSLHIRGCRPHPSSKLHGHGMQIFANGLHLTGDFYMERTEHPCETMILQASCMKAREIQLLSGIEFKGGLLAEKIWNKLIKKLSELRNNHPDPADVFRLIQTHAVAARDVLKTIDLRSAKADVIIISAQSTGIADFHDSQIEHRFLIEAGIDGWYRQAIFSCDASALCWLKAVTGRPDGRKRQSAYDFLMESVQRPLSDHMSPCLDLAGIHCKGELRFDGRDGEDRIANPVSQNGEADPPVIGHVNLANARCRVFTDDESWWGPESKRAYKIGLKNGRIKKLPFCIPHISFDLNCFDYEKFGLNSRFIFENDPKPRFDTDKTPPTDWHKNPESIAVDRELARSDSLGEKFWNSSVRTYRVDPNAIEPQRKVRWLELATRAKTDPDSPKGFDAQPWTQCAKAMRHAGWRQAAEDVLFEREKRIYKKFLILPLFDIVFALFLFFGFVTVMTYFDHPNNLAHEFTPLSLAITRVFALASGLVYFLTEIYYFVTKKTKPPSSNVSWTEEYEGGSGIWRKVGAVWQYILRKLGEPFMSLWYRLLLITVGYGYKAHRAVIQSGLVVLAGAAIFLCADIGNFLIRAPDKDKDEKAAAALDAGEMQALAAAIHRLSEQGAASNSLRDADWSFDGQPSAHLYLASSKDYRDCDGADKLECERYPMAPHAGANTPSSRNNGASLDPAQGQGVRNSDCDCISDSLESLQSSIDGLKSLQTSIDGLKSLQVSIDELKIQIAILSKAIAANSRGQKPTSEAQSGSNPEADYPKLLPVMYALDVFIPVIDFSQAIYWLPGDKSKKKSGADDQDNGRTPENREKKTRGSDLLSTADLIPEMHFEQFKLFVVWVTYWFLIVSGWWYTSVLVGSLTGFLDRKE